MTQPLAFFLTWTCYGAWLPGDARGSVDDEHARFGDPLAPVDLARERANANALRSGSVLLDPPARAVVERAIREHCAHRRAWLGAVNARSNHVHCVVAEPDARPEQVTKRLKAWSTRALRAHHPDRFSGPVWTRHASTRYLWTPSDVKDAVLYVTEEQDRASRLSGAP